MNLPSAARLRELLTPPAGPCVSVYLPTARAYPESQQNAIRYRNLVDQAEGLLKDNYPTRDAQAAIRPFRQLLDDKVFWTHQADGLAVLGGGDTVEVFRLPRTVPEFVAVADSFHLKPLLRLTQAIDRFQVLGISRTETFLWEGDRYGLASLDIPGFPPSYEDVVGGELTEAQRLHIDRGGRSPSTGHYSGAGARKDELDLDQERYLRGIDRAVLDKVSKPSGLPLVLVGLPDNTSEFRKLSGNPHLVPGAVDGDPGSFSPAALLAAVMEVAEPTLADRMSKFRDDYGNAVGRGLASDDPAEIGRALAMGRVGRLFVAADKAVPGSIDPATGAVALGDGADDLLDDLAEHALRTGAEVTVVPADRLPSASGVAAVFRY